MKSRWSTTAALLAVLLFVSPAVSQTPPSDGDDKVPVLVSTEWLGEHLEDPNLIVIHVGEKDAYAEEHIPGARWISARDLVIVTEDGLRDEFPPFEELRSAFEALGAGNQSHFVICYQDAKAIPWASRVYLTLSYMSLGDRASLLNGGLKQWKVEERPLSKEIPIVEAGRLHAVINRKLIVNSAWLFENIRSGITVLIDVRPEEQYSGQVAGHGPRKGHIPGAVNLPFFTLQYENPDYLFKNDAELELMFSEMGADRYSIVVPYCGTGIWSSPVYVVARHLGFKTYFYDAGFQDWSEDEKLPITVPVKRDAEKD